MSKNVRYIENPHGWGKLEFNVTVKLSENERKQLSLALQEQTNFLNRDLKRVKERFESIIPEVEKKIDGMDRLRLKIENKSDIDIWVDHTEKYELSCAMILWKSMLEFKIRDGQNALIEEDLLSIKNVLTKIDPYILD